MKSFFSFLFCGLLFTNILSAQNEPKVPSKMVGIQKGIWQSEQVADNILKLTYQPKGYLKNEQITNAVIAKTQPISKKIPISIQESLVMIGNNASIRIFPMDAEKGYQSFGISLEDDEKIFGGGERALPLNRRGYHFNLYNNPWYGYSEGADNLNFSVPFFTSSKGYGLFFDNGSKGYVDIGKKNKELFEAGFSSGELRIYVILGNTYHEILTSYQMLTGFQPMPPKWAMGNFMSRFGYTSEKQTKEIVAKMRSEVMPFDAVIFDLFWFGDSIKNTLGNIDWVNKTKWPNPKRMIADLKKDYINSILITEPFFLKGTKSYPYAEQYLAKDSVGKAYQLQDFYFGKGGLLDIFRKDAGDWLWKYHYKKQIENGVAGWWTDLGEPEKHPSDLLHNLKDLGVDRMMLADEVHNLYGHYWNKMLFEHYAKDYPNTRLFHLNRSGFSGSQRYSIFPWTGDISRSWSGLRAQLPNILGMSMSGIPYIHSDAGGFAMGDGDAELYLRWLQFSEYTPIFRPHGTALYEVDPNAFSYPSEPALADKSVLSNVRAVVFDRYQLLHYNYSLAYRQAAFGEPLIKPLYYQFPADTKASNIGDEFMWGDALLVAPVLEKGQKIRKIYLPKGDWYDMQENTIFNGDTTISYHLSLKYIPVFVKAGSFIPNYGITPKGTATSSPKVIYINYYPSANPSMYQLYLDDGISKNSIETKAYELIDFKASGLNGKALEINIESNNGVYQGRPNNYLLPLTIINLQSRPTKITVNGKEIEILGEKVNSVTTTKLNQALWFKNKQQELMLNLNYTGEPIKILINW